MRKWFSIGLRSQGNIVGRLLLSELVERADTEGLTSGDALREAIEKFDRVIVNRQLARQFALTAMLYAFKSQDSQEKRLAYKSMRRLVLNGHDEEVYRIHAFAYLQLALEQGDFGEVERVLKSDRPLRRDIRYAIETDLLHPRRGVSTHTEWEDALSRPFYEEGLAPVRVDVDAETLFDGLRANSETSVDGPLVSVIMPAYRPGRSLVSSIESILNQSYENLEVILVDDGSGPEWDSLFDYCASLSARIRLLKHDVNRGSYLARNSAIRVSDGEFITTQDADDWSHPSRIEHQVQMLRMDESASGSVSDAIRAKPDMTLQWLGYSPRRQNASSLMFRRSSVASIGAFLPVRKGGDSEYAERLLQYAGPILSTGSPLAVTRLAEGSLSRGDFSLGWASPERVLFRSLYRHAHHVLEEQAITKPEVLIAHVSQAVPSRFRVSQPLSEYVSEYAFFMDASKACSVDTLLRCLEFVNGPPPAVVHAEDFLSMRATEGRIDSRVLEAALDGSILLAAKGEAVVARKSIVLDSGILEMAVDDFGTYSSEEVGCVVRLASEVEHSTDIAMAIQGARRVFGRRVAWLSRDAHEQEFWAEHGLTIASVMEYAMV